MVVTTVKKRLGLGTGKKIETSKQLAWLMPLLAFSIYGILSSIMTLRRSSTNHKNLKLIPEEEEPFETPLFHHRQQQGSCLSLDIEENMDNLLSKYKHVIIAMPAKAAGSSFKAFTKKCMSRQNATSFSVADNILNDKNKMNSALTAQLKIPSIIASHMYRQSNFCHVVKHATDDTLIVYSHRQETSRLISATKQVISKRPGQWDEKEIVKMIKSKVREIGIGNTQLLTCQQYKCIKDNSPNLVFMHYKKVGQMLKLLAKHHCPELLTQEETRVNIGSDKKPVTVVLKGRNNNGTIVSLDDWLNAKSQMLEIALNMKEAVTCQATTRDIEYDLFACPDETLQISGRSYENSKIQFPF